MPERVQLACGVRVSLDAPAGVSDAWPLPPVDLAAATRTAKDRLHCLRRDPQVRADKAAIVEKHGSRKTLGERVAVKPRSSPVKTTTSPQLSLGFD